jgi:hypothetical protein
VRQKEPAGNVLPILQAVSWDLRPLISKDSLQLFLLNTINPASIVLLTRYFFSLADHKHTLFLLLPDCPTIAVIGRQLLRHECAACSIHTEMQANDKTAVVFCSATQNTGAVFVIKHLPPVAMETAPDPRIVAICLLFCEE